MNKVILIGRLVADPELKYTVNGIARATFTLAVDRPFKDKDGNRQSDFIPVLAWRKKAENVAGYTQKGDTVAVEGRLEISKYEKDGQKMSYPQVIADDVIFLSKKKRDGNDNPNHNGNHGYVGDVGEPPFEPLDISDDDLPF